MAPCRIDFLYPLITLFQSAGEHCMACGGIGLGKWGWVDTLSGPGWGCGFECHKYFNIKVEASAKWIWVALWINAGQGQDFKRELTGQNTSLPLNLEIHKSLV